MTPENIVELYKVLTNAGVDGGYATDIIIARIEADAVVKAAQLAADASVQVAVKTVEGAAQLMNAAR